MIIKNYFSIKCIANYVIYDQTELSVVIVSRRSALFTSLE